MLLDPDNRRFTGPGVHTGFALCLILLLVTGCAALDRSTLGGSVTAKPGWSSFGKSLNRAVRDPNVWGTLLASAVLQTSGQDEKISDRLREDTPLFGSTQQASDASYDFRDLTELAYVSTALLAPGPEKPRDWLAQKSLLLGSEWLTVEMGQLATSEIKTMASRERPNNKDSESFLSGHVSAASAQAQMADINIQYLPIGESSKLALSTSFNGFAALAGWARVEAGEHYPSDVLAGWALGHFIAHIGQSFIDSERQRVLIRPKTGPDSTGIQINIEF